MLPYIIFGARQDIESILFTHDQGPRRNGRMGVAKATEPRSMTALLLRRRIN